MNKIEFSKLEKKEDMIIAFNQLKEDYSLLFSENQELKKQIEELEEQSANAINKQVARGIDLINQQKEFIEWLEYELRTSYKSSSRYYCFSTVLSKYKEIIGGLND